MIPLAGHPHVSLLPEGCVYLTDVQTLIVADIHLGKSATFRARGLPVPEGDTARDLERLRKLLRRCQASRLVIAGDLFHAPAGITPELESALAGFLAAVDIPVTLVIGNHDVKIRHLPAPMHPVSQLDLGESIRVIHDPKDMRGDRLHIAGHLHPVIKIPDGRRTSLRLPCFLLRHQTLVLPAFGSFTGGAIIKPKPGDRIFVALRENVVELPESFIPAG